MTREEAMRRLRDLLPVLQAQYDVAALSLFGSVVRDEATGQSDIDLLVDFRGPATFPHFMGLKLHLEDSLGVRVDLVTRRAIKPRMKPRIEAEAIRVS